MMVCFQIPVIWIAAALQDKAGIRKSDDSDWTRASSTGNLLNPVAFSLVIADIWERPPPPQIPITFSEVKGGDNGNITSSPSLEGNT